MRPASDAGLLWHHPYTVFNKSFDDVLIIGSGSGTDTAVALYHNVSSIDAVEIDPVIIELGKKYHPTNPYGEPSVNVINTDARSYLMQSDKKYDLIIYGLTDSLTLLSSYGNLRLESYLYTVDAFREVKSHLREDGFFHRNAYPDRWFTDKLALMFYEAFDQNPYVLSFNDSNTILTLVGAPVDGLAKPAYVISTDVSAATDDWPFFYLRKPSIPKIYVDALLTIILVTIAFFVVAGPKSLYRINPHFFFLGAAFMLLETKSIVNFSLLYGSTWVVDSLVFFSILLMVLLAVYFVERHETGSMRMWFALLFILLSANYLIPLSVFLSHDLLSRYVYASLFFFSPIFVANVIFSSSFKDAKESNIDYASNILGSMVGGLTEYLSLLFGYSNLIIIAALFYFLAFYKIRR